MSTKDFSNKQENLVAKYLGWKTVVGSGARDFHYGDVISSSWLGECKTHVSKQSSVVFNKNHWVKISDESVFHHRNPALIVDDGTQDISNTYVVFKYQFDGLSTHELVTFEPISVNIRVNPKTISTSTIYVVSGFDSYSNVYICSIELFKELLENG